MCPQQNQPNTIAKILPLSNSGLSTAVSPEDYGWLSKFSWFLKKSRSGWYVCSSKKIKGKVVTLRMHRMVAKCWDDKTVDHLNRDHLNNTRENLEIVTHSENIRRYWDWWGNERFKDRVPF